MHFGKIIVVPKGVERFELCPAQMQLGARTFVKSQNFLLSLKFRKTDSHANFDLPFTSKTFMLIPSQQSCTKVVTFKVDVTFKKFPNQSPRAEQ